MYRSVDAQNWMRINAAAAAGGSDGLPSDGIDFVVYFILGWLMLRRE